MPKTGESASFKRKKSAEKQESKEKVQRTSEEVMGENEKAHTKLARSTEKKESKWKFGVGTTEARDKKNPLNSISSTGVKIENKESNFEVTAGIGTMREQKVPGEIPENTTGATIALNWKF